MNTNTNEFENTAPEAGAPRDLEGAIWQGSPQGSEEALFHWVDEESGQRLQVRVEGDEGFLNGLESLGFVRRRGAYPQGPRGHANETPRRNSEPGGTHAGWQGRRGA